MSLWCTPVLLLPIWTPSHAGHPAVYPYFSKSLLVMWSLLEVFGFGAWTTTGWARGSAGSPATIAGRGPSGTSSLVAWGFQGTPVTDWRISKLYLSSPDFLLIDCTVKTPDPFPTIFSVVLSLTPRKTPCCHLDSNLWPLLRNSTVSPNGGIETLHSRPLCLE